MRIGARGFLAAWLFDLVFDAQQVTSEEPCLFYTIISSIANVIIRLRRILRD